MNITGMSEQWVAAGIQQKGDGKCIPWASLRDLILVHPDVKREVDVLALSTPVPAILADTFRSLSACRRKGESRFIGCAQLLLVWFQSHFWRVDKVPYRVFFENYSPLKEAAAMLRRDDISEERWMEILQNLREEDGAIGYAPLLVLRQYKARQFIPATHCLAQSEFSYKGDNYKKKIREISEAWKQTCCMKILTAGLMTTLEYKGWLSKRINDKIPGPSLEGVRSIEEYLRVVPSELEILKQDFERKSLELRKRIGKLEEEKMHLRLDVDVQKLETEKLRKEKRKIEEDRDSLKTEYKKIHLSMKNAGLGKTSE
ncbi:myosin heavy chain-like [Gossypium australe]|uniref:Myosin heavy chain-like n=1 Tax=Gossypium australe TaxID=47621 RepID=A0A5B6X5T2_9ROSI|nr:myosin heavy chain-like [Gossypium australe]